MPTKKKTSKRKPSAKKASAKRARSGASRVIETDSVSAETKRREESPGESSIERELHPERKN
jgi:hypothetical protein